MNTIPFIFYRYRRRSGRYTMFGLFTLLLSTSETYAQDAPDGWTLGFGGVTVNDNQSVPFPIVKANGNNFMILPNISYKKDQWQLGTGGILWTDMNRNGQEIKFSANYPGAKIQLSKADRWKSFSIEGGLDYSNGLVSKLKASALGVSYEHSQGLEARIGQQKIEWFIKFPVFIAKDGRSLLFATGSLQRENESFIMNDQITGRTDVFYETTGLGVFLVRQLTKQSSLVGSFSIQNTEEELIKIRPLRPGPPTQLFFMYSYHFKN